MNEQRQKGIRLQDLDFIASETTDMVAKETKQKAEREFEQTQAQAAADLAKVFPKAIDVICALNKSITRQGDTLLFENEAVPVELNGGNCVDVCKRVLSTFPNTINNIVTAIRSRSSAVNIKEISRNLCCEFNTLVAFRANAAALKAEFVASVVTATETPKVKDYSDSFTEVISMTIGKCGDKEISLDLNVKQPDAHVAVSGMSGSGKSSFLQTLILGGAYKYSPEQLEFWLLDFKDGTGLVQFQTLKHVKVMSLKNRPLDAGEIMDYIKSEYHRRADLIRQSGGGDICVYNQRAKAAGLPLMPRLIIVIDEFTSMYRSCFAVLNDVVTKARAMGMSFVFSSQIIEQGEAYSESIGQVTHLFEYQNADSVFGRLVREVTDQERKFVRSGVKGNCIYRHDPNRTTLNVAYVGELSEQNALIAKINEKWSAYPYAEPIVTGCPECDVNDLDSELGNGNDVIEEFSRLKRVSVPIGKPRMGNPYNYKIDRKNSLLVAFGDETRIANIELSVIKQFKRLSQSEQSVYYVDLNCNPDRDINAVTATYSAPTDDVCYVATDGEAKTVIDKVHSILTARKNLVTSGVKDIGNPIELIIHNAERIDELVGVKCKPIIETLRVNKYEQAQIPDDMGLDEFINSGTQEQDDKPEQSEKDDEKDVDTLSQLKYIIEQGKNSRIYVMLYFEEKSRFQALINGLFTHNFDFKDVIIVPRIPDDYEELSYSEITGYLTACGLREQANAFDVNNSRGEQTKLMQSDFVCAVLVDDKVVHKLIPYEWDTDNL